MGEEEAMNTVKMAIISCFNRTSLLLNNLLSSSELRTGGVYRALDGMIGDMNRKLLVPFCLFQISGGIKTN